MNNCKNGTNKKDQNFIWGIEDEHMLTEVKSSNLQPSKKDEAITYIMSE